MEALYKFATGEVADTQDIGAKWAKTVQKLNDDEKRANRKHTRSDKHAKWGLDDERLPVYNANPIDIVCNAETWWEQHDFALSLPPVQRKVLHLRLCEGLSQHKIAERLGINLSAVQGAIKRIQANHRKWLAE